MENTIKAGCGSLNDAQFDQLSLLLKELEDDGMSAEFVNGVACGLGFVALEKGETIGFDFKRFVSNAYLNFTLSDAARKTICELLKTIKEMGL